MKSIFRIKESPYVLLLFTTIALLFALAFRPIANMSFQDKTIFSIPVDSVVWFFPLLLISMWLFYLLTVKFLYSSTITWIHVLTTAVTTILIVIVLCIGINPSQFTIERHELIGAVMQLLFILLIFAQLIYIANVLIGIGKYKRGDRVL